MGRRVAMWVQELGTVYPKGASEGLRGCMREPGLVRENDVRVPMGKEKEKVVVMSRAACWMGSGRSSVFLVVRRRVSEDRIR